MSRLSFLAARGLGCAIDRCHAFLAFHEVRDRAGADVKALAEDHLGAIRTKITELHAMEAVLSELVHGCAGDHRPDCPALSDLADASQCHHGGEAGKGTFRGRPTDPARIGPLTPWVAGGRSTGPGAAQSPSTSIMS